MKEDFAHAKEDRITAIEFEVIRHRLKASGALVVPVVTNSMAPFVKVGERVRVEPISDFSLLKSFDVLMYWNGTVLVCHYLLSRSGFKDGDDTKYLLKGLKNDEIDIPVTESSILGRVTKKIPLAFRLREWFKWRRL